MPLSDARKAANAKWDKKNMATLACKVKKEQAESFKEYSAKRGKSANTVLKDYVIKCISEDGDETED